MEYKLNEHCFFIDVRCDEEWEGTCDTLSYGKIDKIVNSTTGQKLFVDGNETQLIFKTFNSAIEWWNSEREKPCYKKNDGLRITRAAFEAEFKRR